MKQVTTIAALFFSILAYSQGDQTIINVPISSTTTEKAILHLPDDYSVTTTNYPVMVFLHGAGEGGTNPASIYGSAAAGGPAYFIAQKTFPASFINPIDGKAYKFIVVSPQSTNGWSTTAGQLDTVLTYLLKTYRIDAARLYLTGLSAGGEGILEYVGKIDANGIPVLQTHKIAAFLPMSAVMNASLEPKYDATIFSDNVHIWGFGSPTDTHGANTLNMIWYLNNTTQKSAYGLTTSYVGGHCCWGQFYNPAFTQAGLNIYQWALQYTRSGVVQPPPPVIVPSACDSAGIIKAWQAAHPCPKVDTAAILKLAIPRTVKSVIYSDSVRQNF